MKKIKDDLSAKAVAHTIYANNRKGITLIALVITIILLLILAGISIFALVDSGLFDKTKEAEEKYSQAQEEEEEYLKKYQNLLLEHENGSGTGLGGGSSSDSGSGSGTNTSSGSDTSEDDVILSTDVDFGEITWSNGKASVGIRTNTNYYIEYQKNAITDGNWTRVQTAGESVTIDNLNNNDVVYARLTNGISTGKHTMKLITDTTAPTVTVSLSEITTESITAIANAVDNETGIGEDAIYTFYIKETDAEEETYEEKQSTTLTTCIITGLKQSTEYTVKVEVKDIAGNTGTGTDATRTEVMPDADDDIETGNITFGEAEWDNGQASVEISTSTNYYIEYQINEITEGNWTRVETARESVTVSELVDGDILYARLTDGTNAGDYATLEIVGPAPTFANINIAETNPANAIPIGAEIIVNDAIEGIVIKDTNNNEWTWVIVPKTIYTDETYTVANNNISVTNSTDYTGIYNILNKYAEDYREGNDGQSSNFIDEWYDYCGTTYDGVNEYSKINYINSSSTFNTSKNYYGTLYRDNTGTIDYGTYSSSKTFYAKITDKLEDRSGCGLTYSEYNNYYKKMLSSIYTNGGFWISRYEAGIENSDKLETGRITDSDRITSNSLKAVSQVNMIPYNYVKCCEAQKLASMMSTDNTQISSLLFGIQWDLVCKYLEGKDGLTKEMINLDSTDWGNYGDSSIKLVRGRYCLYPSSSVNCIWKPYNVSTTDSSSIIDRDGTTVKNKNVLLSTGASDDTRKMNIYDFVGNEREFTLECADDSPSHPCITRGGTYTDSGSKYTASFLNPYYVDYGSYNISFRITLY